MLHLFKAFVSLRTALAQSFYFNLRTFSRCNLKTVFQVNQMSTSIVIRCHNYVGWTLKYNCISKLKLDTKPVLSATGRHP
jgi:hypothetical protein